MIINKSLTAAIPRVQNMTLPAVKRWISRFLVTGVIYVLLTEFVFVFVFPFFFMTVNSLKYDFELKDINREWVLTQLNFSNYEEAVNLLKYGSTLSNTLIIVILSTFGHVFSCAFIAYGIARFRFPGKNIVFALVILSLIVPPQILTMPLYIQYAKIRWISTFMPIIVPSYFGFGLKGGLFIFIYRQFFKGLPASYEEAAKIEGCGSLNVFFKIILPMSRTCILVVAILSIIWHWNDYFEPYVYLKGSKMMLSQILAQLPDWFYWNQLGTGQSVNPVQLAACFLVTLPVLIIFFIFQKQFIQGIETSGLAN